MRRADREITDRRTIDWIIAQARVCRLGLCRDDVPYVVPVNFGYDGVYVYFHTASSGMKIDFLASNPRICFEFEHDVQIVPHESRACGWSTSYHSVIGWGTVSEITDREPKEGALLCIMRHYSDRNWDFAGSELERVRVWRVSVDEIVGKRSDET